MVYSNNFVAVVKSNGKILRENKNTVAVPFGSEYSILLKNQSSVRAVANVWLDGIDVTDGRWVIIDANSSLELERFIRKGNLNKGNKFKFIERTGQIEEHRGIGVDDGLVRVEYKFEVPQTFTYSYPYYTTVYNGGGLTGGIIGTSGLGDVNVNYTVTQPSSILRSAATKSEPMAMNCCVTPTSSRIGGDASEASMFRDASESSVMFAEAAPNEAGITVPGGVSHQKFVQGPWFATETTSHVIVLKLVGKVKGVNVFEPVTVQAKPACSTCGKLNKATHKHCDRCGTALQLF